MACYIFLNEDGCNSTFWSQIGLGITEFSDLSMDCPPETLHSLYEAKYVARYLEKYADKFDYEGRSLRDRMVFGFTVTKIEKQNGRVGCPR